MHPSVLLPEKPSVVVQAVQWDVGKVHIQYFSTLWNAMNAVNQNRDFNIQKKIHGFALTKWAFWLWKLGEPHCSETHVNVHLKKIEEFSNIAIHWRKDLSYLNRLMMIAFLANWCAVDLLALLQMLKEHLVFWAKHIKCFVWCYLHSFDMLKIACP